MVVIPNSHPRADSLLIREKLVRGFDSGVVAKEGLLAHGRGEAFDYLIGEKTSKSAKIAIKAAAACLILSKKPVISVNGNFSTLCTKEIVLLSNITQSKIEVNIFYAARVRKQKITNLLKRAGAKEVLGNKKENNKKLSGLDSNRRMVDVNGIYSSDVVLVPLEDGDRTEALIHAGKKVITFDLNPLSRTAQKATITIVDNVTRGINELIDEIKKLSTRNEKYLEKILVEFDNKKNLALSVTEIKDHLEKRGKIA